jgi:hypothetical protein
MRYLGLLIAACGAVAIVMGTLATLTAARTVPFRFEATNHVGQIIGGLLCLPLGLYLHGLFRKQPQ